MGRVCALLLMSAILIHCHAVRLHKLFQYIDGYKSEHSLHGFLHVGADYAVFLKVPRSHDKMLVYELYEAKNVPEKGKYTPRLLAVSKIPVEYIRDQLKIFRNELYNAKYVNNNTVPGTQVKTIREWQIEKALSFHDEGKMFYNRAPVLRNIL